MTRLVIDVSAAQGPILDTAGFLAAGVAGAYVESTVGNDGPNPLFQSQVAQLQRAGIPVGAYLFAYPLPNAAGHANRDPQGQANLFFRDSGGLGNQPGELPPMLDSEWPHPIDWAKWGVTAESQAAWLDACGQAIDALWKRASGIYTDADGYWKVLGKAGTRPSFAARRLWLAMYPHTRPRKDVPTTFPTAPAPWSGAPALWQFTDKFSIGRKLYDASVFTGTDQDWRSFLQGE